MTTRNSQLLNNIDVEHFLNVLGVEFEPARGGLEVNFHCPFPGHQNGDQNASAYMNKKTTAWFCHGCHKRGNAINFAADIKGISPMLALQYMREKYDPSYFESGPTSTSDELRRILVSKPQPKEDRQPILPPDTLDRFHVDWYNNPDIPYIAYMLDRGYDPETLDNWDIGYDPHSDRITIPVRDERNELIGFKARTYTDKEPKYLVLGDRQGKQPYYGWGTYAVGRVVFGLASAILAQDPYLEDGVRHFVLCEGELNAISLWQAGYAGIAINGSNLTQYQIEIIKREADRLTLFFDNDSAGERATQAALDEFTNHMPVDIIISDYDAADKRCDDIDVLMRNTLSGTKYLLSSNSA